MTSYLLTLSDDDDEPHEIQCLVEAHSASAACARAESNANSHAPTQEDGSRSEYSVINLSLAPCELERSEIVSGFNIDLRIALCRHLRSARIVPHDGMWQIRHRCGELFAAGDTYASAILDALSRIYAAGKRE